MAVISAQAVSLPVFIKQHCPALEEHITTWLKQFGKTVDDVAWWEMLVKEDRTHITVIFSSDEQEHKKTYYRMRRNGNENAG